MVALILADGFEEVEAITPIDILRRGGVDVVTYSITDDLCVCGAHNIMVDADDYIANIEYEKVDAVILPGGLKGTENMENCKDVQFLLEYMHQNNKLMCAICAAPRIFGNLDYLDGRKATCYPEFDYCLKGAYTGDRVTVDRQLITSKGMGTAMDFALAILEYLKDSQTAEKIARASMYR